jgi:hypothetical protein
MFGSTTPYIKASHKKAHQAQNSRSERGFYFVTLVLFCGLTALT